MDTIKSEVRVFLYQNIRYQQIQDDDDIFSLGYVNSLFAMQFVLFLEKKFDITVDNEDLDISNFNTINAVAELVHKKQAMSA